MTLNIYKKKRDFKKSPEPTGGKPDTHELKFVVQKHEASHLHYDFRLEMDGVLKSWAVPKGPSMDPKIKRLAMMVEDHPYDYRNFEGIIPDGYGAGTVMVWDEGTYFPAESNGETKKSLEKELLRQLKSGKIKFVLKGKKLKGEFALVKSFGRGEKSWLLMKLDDKYASANDVLKKDKSVISKKTIEQIKKTTTNFYEPGHSTKKNSRQKKSAAAVKNKKQKQEHADMEIDEGEPAKFPTHLSPMLATLVDKPFDKPGWIYEVKWDGYRTLAFINKGNVELKSRNDKSFNEKFYPVYEALKNRKINAVVDGEIVVLKKNGQSDFGALQNWRSEDDGELYYYIFDLLWLNGKDLTKLPLIKRKEILKRVIPDDEIIRLSEDFSVNGIKFFDSAKRLGLEGVIAKKSDSVYQPGRRSDDWLKIKASKRQEMVIGGFTRNENTSKLFSSLLVGIFEKGKLIYTGKVGTGFNEKSQREILRQFRPLITKKAPFTETPDINKPSRFRPDPPNAKVTWLKPKLVCEVNFTEMTRDGIMRHPSFIGMRIDKNANDVIREKPVRTKNASVIAGKNAVRKILKPSSGRVIKTFLNPSEETQVRTIKGHELKFTNLSKIYWPGEGITKRDMLNYYYQVAPYILPYLKNRPQSLNRYPNGIKGENFYQKDVTGKVPGWIKTYLYHSENDARDKHFLVGTDEASLLYMASLGCIEMNPWSSTIDRPDNPDWCIIDLDPADNSFDKVIEAAKVTREILEGMNVPSYPKTSGSTGMHIYIPLGAKYTYDQSKEFARIIATLVNKKIPKFTSIERAVKARKGKMYIDFLQNRPQATISAPYSLRPKPGATVSMPLHWEEVKKGLKMKDFTIHNAIDRIKNEGDIFKAVLSKGINLKKVINEFQKN